MGRLSAAGAMKLRKVPGRHVIGDGLCLVVRKSGRAAWIARLQSDGKRRDYGLGSLDLVSLSEARERCREMRKALHEGRDPHALHRPAPGARRIFRDVALEFVTAKLSPGGRDRALGRLKLHAFPKLGKLQLQSINADIIADCLSPIWQTKPETARKVRILIIRTLRYGLPDGTALIGTLARAVSDRLPDQPRGSNFAALDFRRTAEVFSRLAGKTGFGSLALRLLILTATRSQEVRLARWDEIDLNARIWTIPADRMKMKREHRIPLSPQACSVLIQAYGLRRTGTDLIFPSARDDVLSDATMLKALRDADHVSRTGKTTVHGFRSSFTDWTAELTSFPREIADACLSHKIRNPVEAAYLRTTFFDKRRDLMDLWGAFCDGSSGAEILKLDRA